MKPKLFYFVVFCNLLTVLVRAQQPLEVNYTATNGGYTFQYKNPNFCDYSVKVEFAELQGGTCDCGLPFTESVTAGSGTLFTLKPAQANQSISFRYSYRSAKGRMLSKPPKPFVYLLPFSPQKPHRAAVSKSITEVVLGRKVADFYGLSFSMNKGDTVYAARRGIVSQTVGNIDKYNDNVWFSSETNFIEIFHQDGSFMRYNRLKKGALLVKEGDEVEAGQPIGIVADDAFEGSTVVQLTAYYLSKANAFSDTNHSFTYFAPTFYTQETPEGTLMQSLTFYTSAWPERIITQEMPKRVLKKWKTAYSGKQE